jgi:hypothetical protein
MPKTMMTAAISTAARGEAADRLPREDVSQADIWSVLSWLVLMISSAARAKK